LLEFWQSGLITLKPLLPELPMVAKVGTDTVRVLGEDESTPRLSIVESDGSARALVWPGMGARLRSLVRISLSPQGCTHGLMHPVEAVYYVVQGSGNVVELGAGSEQPVGEGSMVHIEPETPYRFFASDDGMELLGGPCPADEPFFRRFMQ
jgi:mannose-6-phosphate isomerase-like protein (cupin superfamily)